MNNVLKIVTWALRLQLSALFLWASYTKFVSPQEFVEGVRSFQIFPEVTVNIIVMSVPVMELLAAILLLAPRSWRIGALLVGLLSLTFAVLFAWAASRGVNVECSCFGASSLTAHSTTFGFVRAVILLVVSGFLYWVSLRRKVYTENW